MDWMQIVSLVLNLVFGGGLVMQFATIKSQRNKGDAEANKAIAEAKTSELDNVQEAVKIWREMAEELKTELQASRETAASQIDALSKQVSKLNDTINRFMRLLDKITPDNVHEVVNEIKNEITI